VVPPHLHLQLLEGLRCEPHQAHGLGSARAAIVLLGPRAHGDQHGQQIGSRCGVRLYAMGELAQLGGRFYAIHVPTVDDLDPGELAEAPLQFRDNAHGRPDRTPADIRLM
jgi:hypothetical protein